MNQMILKGENLSRRYEGDGVTVNALTDASFEIREREFVVVLGPSGSGKSTLLNLLGGMDCPSGGRLWYRDTELTEFSSDRLAVYRKDVVGFVFQFFNLIPSLTAAENVELAASIVKDPMDCKEVLKLVGLADRGNHFPSQLSGGEQQRVSIARAIVKNPGVLLCDEPTGALDSKNSIAVVRLLLEVRDRLGCPVVTITHNPEMARVADRVFHVKDGRIDRVADNPAPVPVEELEW
ncbi:ABC transporter ATP-binding protein [Marasmitruncus massiliensis]|uniref:ABC transporter ATP-binding protein n=1 Tax=Marasmitruncus massiliensis TaxID=1944642 RepID=UPI0015E062D0|nr:ABC transporter ATP-binding protein [Marasmitruncus massiliensis]